MSLHNIRWWLVSFALVINLLALYAIQHSLLGFWALYFISVISHSSYFTLASTHFEDTLLVRSISIFPCVWLRRYPGVNSLGPLRVSWKNDRVFSVCKCVLTFNTTYQISYSMFADFGARHQRFPMKEINVLEFDNVNDWYGYGSVEKDSGSNVKWSNVTFGKKHIDEWTFANRS